MMRRKQGGARGARVKRRGHRDDDSANLGTRETIQSTHEPCMEPWESDLASFEWCLFASPPCAGFYRRPSIFARASRRPRGSSSHAPRTESSPGNKLVRDTSYPFSSDAASSLISPFGHCDLLLDDGPCSMLLPLCLHSFSASRAGGALCVNQGKDPTRALAPHGGVSFV